MSIKIQSHWTPTGAHCHHSNAECGNCPIFVNYGFSENNQNPEKKCFQPRANAKLIQEGFEPPPDLNKAEKLVKAINKSFSIFSE